MSDLAKLENPLGRMGQQGSGFGGHNKALEWNRHVCCSAHMCHALPQHHLCAMGHTCVVAVLWFRVSTPCCGPGDHNIDPTSSAYVVPTYMCACVRLDQCMCVCSKLWSVCPCRGSISMAPRTRRTHRRNETYGEATQTNLREIPRLSHEPLQSLVESKSGGTLYASPAEVAGTGLRK